MELLAKLFILCKLILEFRWHFHVDHQMNDGFISNVDSESEFNSDIDSFRLQVDGHPLRVVSNVDRNSIPPEGQ